MAATDRQPEANPGLRADFGREEDNMGILSTKLSLVVLMAAISQPICPADAGEAWPQRAVKVIIPLPAGTGVDISARLFAEQLTRRWGQPVIIENMPGADGIVAVNEFVRRADNYTLLYSFAGLITINPVLHKKLSYDPARDLVPIATTSYNSLAIAVTSKLQAASLRELVAHARSHPAKLNWAAPPPDAGRSRSNRLQYGVVVVFRLVHAGADRPHGHGLARIRHQQVTRIGLNVG
jgi:tripartite-type tricarboxylate transporter receptor subunit TctC